MMQSGNAAAYGPVRALCANRDRSRLWGTAGDDEDLGMVFHYDDRAGLRQLGFLIYNLHGYFDGPSARNVISAVRDAHQRTDAFDAITKPVNQAIDGLSADERFIAVGGADRIGAIHIARIVPS